MLRGREGGDTMEETYCDGQLVARRGAEHAGKGHALEERVAAAEEEGPECVCGVFRGCFGYTI